ncbi:MAG: magnesium transporter CorA, partial [Ramlibacter sp.]
MHIVEFASGTLRFLEEVPAKPPSRGFIWIYAERESLEAEIDRLQDAALKLGGSAILDLHMKDLGNRAHPSYYDYTSVYDLVVFRRLATQDEVRSENPHAEPPPDSPLDAFNRISTRAVGFVVFDRLLITMHPAGCFAANAFI